MRKPWPSREELEQMFECRGGVIYRRTTDTPVENELVAGMVRIGDWMHAPWQLAKRMGCEKPAPAPKAPTVSNVQIKALGPGRYTISYCEQSGGRQTRTTKALGHFPTLEAAMAAAEAAGLTPPRVE